MGDWQGAWFLAKHEMRNNRWGLMLTLLMIIYFLLFLVPMFEEVLYAGRGWPAGWVFDFLLISLLPCLGMMSTQMVTMYWKADPYTKKLIHWRTMPISSRQIALGKLVQFSLTLISAQIVFFILYYVGIKLMGVDIKVDSYILFSVFWLGFSHVFGVIYTYLETGYSGKQYSIIYFFIVAIIMAGTLLFSYVVRKSMTYFILKAFDNGHWWVAMIGVALGISALFIGLRAIERRLQRRPLVN